MPKLCKSAYRGVRGPLKCRRIVTISSWELEMGPYVVCSVHKRNGKGPLHATGSPRAPVGNVEGPLYAAGTLMGKRPLGPIGKIEGPLYATGPTW